NPAVTRPASLWHSLDPPFYKPTSARPLANLSLARNYRLGGMDPRGYHVVNVILHNLGAMVLLAIVRRALLLDHFEGRFNETATIIALLSALIWALHPLQTEAVQYITQRTEVMAG